MSVFGNRVQRAQRAEMAISERELSQLTRELDELHESTFLQVSKTIDELPIAPNTTHPMGVGHTGC